VPNRAYSTLIAVVLLACVAKADTLTPKDLQGGVTPKPGDQIVLDDFSNLAPNDVFSKTSVRGKWWLRQYKTDSGKHGTMLMTVERDMDKPETCLVPRVTLPLNLKGWYEVWVATYRGPYGGGIDVKLSGDECFIHIDPQQVADAPGWPKPRVGAIVEINYKPAADLTGQNMVFQQPFGTYESFHWGFCEASLAYVRLVKLNDEQVAAFRTDQAREDRRLIAFDDDNFSRFWMWGGQDRHAILRFMEAMRYHDIAFYGLNLGATTSLHIPTPHTDLLVSHFGRLGDRRVNATYKAFVDNKLDILSISAEGAHRCGFKLLPTLRMSAIYCQGPKYKALSKWRLKDRQHLDFAQPEIHDYFVTLVRYILETYDVDGFILDFTRHRIHFNPEQTNKAELMNQFSAKMRQMVDDVSRKKGRKLLLGATFTNASYASSPPLLEVQGIDVAAWVRNGYYDIILPEGPVIDACIKMTRGTTTKCYPRWIACTDIQGKLIDRGAHDPTPQEDKKDRPVDAHFGADEYEKGWVELRDKGADGLYIFNNPEGWVGLRRMGHLDEARQRMKAGQTHGLIEGPSVRFLD